MNAKRDPVNHDDLGIHPFEPPPMAGSESDKPFSRIISQWEFTDHDRLRIHYIDDPVHTFAQNAEQPGKGMPSKYVDRFFAWSMAIEDDARLQETMVNVKPNASKSAIEAKREASQICEAAVEFLTRNTLGRKTSAATERSRKGDSSALLNLPVLPFVEFVQRKVANLGDEETPEVLLEFTQARWKRYWEAASLFHEDLIRFVLRPEVQFQGLVAEWNDSTSVGGGTPGIVFTLKEIFMQQAEDFYDHLALVTVSTAQQIAFDPVRQLGLLIENSLPSHPVVKEMSRELQRWETEYWFDTVGYAEQRYPLQSREGIRLEDRLLLAHRMLLASQLQQLARGFIANPLNRDESGFLEESKTLLFHGVEMLAIGYERMLLDAVDDIQSKDTPE